MQVVQTGRVFNQRRPIDKAIINIVKIDVVAANQATVLVTATFPCTIVGLRWDISVIASAGSQLAAYVWVIVVVRDGVTASGIAKGDAATLYAPEQDVLTWGRGMCNTFALTADQPVRMTGDTKTMRKLMGGDTLQFICFGEATNKTTFEGAIQFFCKT